MRVYIQSMANGMPRTHNGYIAAEGFREMGFEVLPFCRADALSDCRPDDILVGGVSIITGKLAEYGIEVPDLNYPSALQAFLGRRLWRTTLDRVLRDPKNRPVFVKPVREKRFTGLVLRSEMDSPHLANCLEDEPVICSEVVEFLAEWRVFVRYGTVLDVRPYCGDWRCRFDPAVIEQAVDAFCPDPAGYALDFGCTEDGRTLLVEVNDGFSLGSYGLAAIPYAKLLSARWSELVGISDLCDSMLDKVEWKKRRDRNRSIL